MGNELADLYILTIVFTDATKYSPISGPPPIRTCRVHSVLVPMDELFADARSDAATYHPHVGHVFGK